jgi:hypothetical protein
MCLYLVCLAEYRSFRFLSEKAHQHDEKRRKKKPCASIHLSSRFGPPPLPLALALAQLLFRKVPHALAVAARALPLRDDAERRTLRNQTAVGTGAARPGAAVELVDGLRLRLVAAADDLDEHHLELGPHVEERVQRGADGGGGGGGRGAVDEREVGEALGEGGEEEEAAARVDEVDAQVGDARPDRGGVPAVPAGEAEQVLLLRLRRGRQHGDGRRDGRATARVDLRGREAARERLDAGAGVDDLLDGAGGAGGEDAEVLDERRERQGRVLDRGGEGFERARGLEQDGVV